MLKRNTYVQSIEKVRIMSSVMASWRFRLLGSYVWGDSGLTEPLVFCAAYRVWRFQDPGRLLCWVLANLH